MIPSTAFSTSSTATGELGKLYSGLNSYATAVPNGNHPDDDETAPKAFVTILLFDKDYNLVDAAWKQITTVGLQSSPTVKQPPHDYMFREVTVREPGFAYVFVSNEHPTYVDVYFDDVTVTHTPSPIVSSSDYFAFGLQHTTGERAGVYEQRHLYNSKELQDELSLNTIDFGWRQYDPAIARWNVVDPLADRRHWMTPFNYVQNNPLSRFDPNGLTDFTLNKKTGEVKEVVYKDEKKQAKNKAATTDRIVKMNNKTGEVKENRKGEAKTAVGDIAKGILEDGHNFKTRDKVIDVNGEGQPTKDHVQQFLLNLSNYIDKEIGGYYLSQKGQENISHIYIGGYKFNNDQKAWSGLFLPQVRPDLVGKTNLRYDFHTHLSKFRDEYRLYPSDFGPDGGDIGHKQRMLIDNPSLKFIIITSPEQFSSKVKIIPY
jgi:RHS repeat-associated protein